MISSSLAGSDRAICAATHVSRSYQTAGVGGAHLILNTIGMTAARDGIIDPSTLATRESGRHCTRVVLRPANVPEAKLRCRSRVPAATRRGGCSVRAVLARRESMSAGVPPAFVIYAVGASAPDRSRAATASASS